MKAIERRTSIATLLKRATNPIKANDLADKFTVSRQVIVGDIALLRARNLDIIATNQGYLLASSVRKTETRRYFHGTIACLHDQDLAEEELRIIVNHGGAVEDVEVDHPFYGIIKASLKIESHDDIDDFFYQMSQHEGEMLSSLTNGIHLHRISAPSRKEFDEIKDDLLASGILLDDAH